jgi:hypothetical protein
VLARLGADDELRELVARLPEVAWSEEINTPPLAEVVWATRDRARAEQLLALSMPYRTRWMIYWFDCEITEAPAIRVAAYLAGIAGDWQECDRLYHCALTVVESVGRRSMAARMRFELGDLLRREEREPARAQVLLTEARTLAREIGLADLVALIDRRHPSLASASIRPAASPSLQPAPSFSMVAEGEYFAISTARRTLRFKATRGMQYLARLVQAPDVAIHVLELAGSADHADRGDAGELIDPSAFRAYRERLEALREVVEDAQTRGDTDRAEHARDEMETIAQQLARASGRGGRARRAESAVDRARSAVQRRIKDAVQRVVEQDPELGGWLQRVVSTGNYCSFRPRA